jgi:hypothetical protein
VVRPSDPGLLFFDIFTKASIISSYDIGFYCKFYDCLNHILFKIFNTVYVEGKLSRSMRAGILSLIYKKKGDKRVLKNYLFLLHNLQVHHFLLV